MRDSLSEPLDRPTADMVRTSRRYTPNASCAALLGCSGRELRVGSSGRARLDGVVTYQHRELVCRDGTRIMEVWMGVGGE